MLVIAIEFHGFYGCCIDARVLEFSTRLTSREGNAPAVFREVDQGHMESAWVLLGICRKHLHLVDLDLRDNITDFSAKRIVCTMKPRRPRFCLGPYAPIEI